MIVLDDVSKSLLCVLAERVESESCQIVLANLGHPEVNACLADNAKLCDKAWFKIVKSVESVVFPVNLAGLFNRSLNSQQIDATIAILNACSVPDKVRRYMLGYGIAKINVEQAIRINQSDWFTEADREAVMAKFLQRGSGDREAMAVLSRAVVGVYKPSFFTACKIQGVISAEEILAVYNARSLSAWYLMQIMDYRNDVFELIFDRFLLEAGDELALSRHLFDEPRRSRLIEAAQSYASPLDRSRVLLYLAANPNTPFDVAVNIMASLGCNWKEHRFLKSNKVRGLGELVRVVNERFRLGAAPLGVKTDWRSIVDPGEQDAVNLILNQLPGKHASLVNNDPEHAYRIANVIDDATDYSEMYPTKASKAKITTQDLLSAWHSEAYFILKSEVVEVIDDQGVVGWEIFCRTVPGWSGSVHELSETVLTLV